MSARRYGKAVWCTWMQWMPNHQQCMNRTRHRSARCPEHRGLPGE